MNSAFGARLFRLFLLFALAPSVVLVLLGYYLAVEPGVERGLRDDDLVGDLNTYYSSLLDSTIVTILERPNAREILEQRGFFMLYVKDTLRSVWTKLEVAHRVAQPVGKAILAGREQGVAPVGDQLYQYVSVQRGDTMLVGGVAHAPEFTGMLESYRGVRADESAMGDLRTRYAVFLSLVFSLVVIVTIGLAYFFSTRLSRSLARPVAELDQATSRIAAGEFGIVVPEQGVGEIRDLIGNFNRMSQQLESTTARLTQTERVAAWQHVARRFAHELKNPLQPITISLYQIRKELTGTPAYGEVCRPLEAVAEELQHLTDLAERFSKLAKLPAPKLELVDLGKLLSSVAELYRERAAEYEFVLELPGEPVMAAIDPTYFREAIHNLIQNAMDATASGGQICLRLQRTADAVEIEVADSGKGMPAEVLRNARMPYFTTRPTGTGLGLAIVEKTVSEHGGRLEVQSAEGKGTTVMIQLPAAAEDERG